MRRKLHVNLGENSYDILIEKGLLKKASEEISEVFKGSRVFVITDDKVAPHYLEALEKELEKRYEVSHIILENGEKTKAISSLEPIYSALIDFGLTRKDLIITLGGGVIGDLGGFVASTFLRGVDFIQVPTTLLSQVDSSVGGKVAVNLKKGKNLVGSFYQPRLVLIDPDVLDTLDYRTLKDGFMEVVKYGCIFDADFFEMLEGLSTREAIMDRIEEIVYRCCDFKRIVVEEDERDTGERMKLNFGHTLAHGIEAFYRYEKYTHGEAVGIGMHEITKLSERKGLTKPGCADRIRRIMENLDMDFDIGAAENEEILSHVKSDKKMEGSTLNVILLEDIGKCFIYRTDTDFFRK